MFYYSSGMIFDPVNTVKHCSVIGGSFSDKLLTNSQVVTKNGSILTALIHIKEISLALLFCALYSFACGELCGQLIIVHYSCSFDCIQQCKPCIGVGSSIAMAERPSSAKQALEKLNEQLTCPICLDEYTDPKLLRCFHVFCEKCLLPLARKTPQVVECPNCRHPTALPPAGVPGLQGAFLIHHLFDIRDILKQVSTPAGTTCVKCEKEEPTCYCRSCGLLCTACKHPHLTWKEFATHELVSLDQLTEDATNLVPPAQKVLHCPRHPAKELDLYCETCKEVICRDCIVKVHRDHQYDLVTDVFPQQKKVLVSSVEPAEEQLASVNKALEGLKSLCGDITSQRQTLEREIRVEIDIGHQALREREELLVSQLDQLTQQKMKSVAAQQDKLELVATRLKSCCGFLQESLRTGSQVEILAMAQSFVQQVKDMTTSFKPGTLEPEEAANMGFFSSRNEMSQMCQKYGRIFDSCAEGDGLRLTVVREKATATVQVVDHKGREYKRKKHDQVKVSFELVSSDGSRRVRGETEGVGDNRYRVNYCARQRGPHTLHIGIGGKHISGSPFSLSVITTTPSNIITGVERPWGLALGNEGQLVVVEHGGNCLSIFGEGGKKKMWIGCEGSGQGQLDHPCGVAISATGNILVGDQFNHRIQVFSPDGQSVKCVGTRGSGPLQFTHPIGIAIHPHSRKIYVADVNNSRIQVLNEDMTFSRTLGSEGSGNGQFRRLLGLSFDTTGNVYVADTDNHRVQVFTADGQYIRQFGKKGSGQGELDEPRDIALDSNDLVYVTDWSNHRISVFTREGHFLRSFGTRGSGAGQFHYPTGIAISKNGAVYVSDCHNSRVQVF